MTNVNAPGGLYPVKHQTGGEIRYGGDYTIASALASNIFAGDLVKSTGTGRNIDVCAAGDRAVGVFYGVKYIDSSGNVQFKKYWATGTVATEIEAYVFDDPDLVFEAQASAGFVAADVGTVADVTAATAGIVRTGRSGMQIDSTTFSASGSAQLKVLGLVPRPDNDYGTNAKVLVMINEHELRAAMTAV